MIEPSETSGRPLASTPNQPEGNTVHQPTSTLPKHRKSSQSSDDRLEQAKNSSPCRRPGTTKEALSGPRTGSSRSEQRSTTSPIDMTSQLSSVHYTRTGRISKAKKGLKVHNCESCGRSYTRAEHLRRHQKNHAPDDVLVCDIQDCGKIFYRIDLLHRHQERHNEPDKESRQQSVYSPEDSSEAPQSSVPGLVPSGLAGTTLPPTSYYPLQPVSPIHEPAALPRYTYNSFRTPQIPRTPHFPSSGFNHLLRSSPTSTSSPNRSKHQGGAYIGRHSVPGSVPIDVMTPTMGWNEPYSQSPGYSSSSGYASPIPGPGDFVNMLAHSPYHSASNRGSTSSNASFAEQWSSLSRSPTSTASTGAYTWASNDKMSSGQNVAYMGTSYTMNIPLSAHVDPMAGYGHYDANTMLQRDDEEGAILFAEQPYGMGPIAHTYPFEQYLDYYWRLFHPAFPVVHRSTVEAMSPSPMLHAAMIAIGGQYSNDTSVKRKSRILHDRCIKLLERRDQDTIAEPDRLCDYQAMFLVEVLSQYRARRAAKVLSSRFEKVYLKSVEDYRMITSRISDIVFPPIQLEGATVESWVHWIELETWQRLLISCYILESQQAILLAREHLPSLIQESGFDLPFPGNISLWDARDPTEWAFAAQQHPHLPRYVFEATPDLFTAPFDVFQSSMLLAVHYNRCESSAPYASSLPVMKVEHLLDESPITKRKLLTAKLVQVTPLRALLSVSGESWILSEKVASAQAFATLKTTLRIWVAQLWTAAVPELHACPVKEALRLSIEILDQALKEQQQQDSRTLEIGTDMGIYFAGLVLWAITTAANTRVKPSSPKVQQQPHRRQSQPPMVFTSDPLIALPASTPLLHSFSHHSSLLPTSGPICGPSTALASLVLHSQPASPISQASTDSTSLLSHAQITINTITFLSTAMLDFGDATSSSSLPMNIAHCREGCISLLMWVKLRLRGVPLNDFIGVADAWVSKPGKGLGELLDGVTGSLERILSRGWSGWGI